MKLQEWVYRRVGEYRREFKMAHNMGLGGRKRACLKCMAITLIAYDQIARNKN